MEHSLEKRKPSLQLKGTLQNSELKLGKLTKVADIISPENVEPSLVRLKIDHSEESVKVVIAVKLTGISNIVGADLNEEQLNYLVDYLLREYYFLTLSDFNLIPEIILNKKDIAKPTIKTIINAFSEYMSRRTDASEEMQARKAKKLNSHNEKEALEWREMYMQMLNKKKVKPLSTAEKAAIARERNSERIRELEKQIGNLPDELKSYVPKYKDDK